MLNDFSKNFPQRLSLIPTLGHLIGAQQNKTKENSGSLGIPPHISCAAFQSGLTWWLEPCVDRTSSFCKLSPYQGAKGLGLRRGHWMTVGSLLRGPELQSWCSSSVSVSFLTSFAKTSLRSSLSSGLVPDVTLWRSRRFHPWLCYHWPPHWTYGVLMWSNCAKHVTLNPKQGTAESGQRGWGSGGEKEGSEHLLNPYKASGAACVWPRGIVVTPL